MKAGDIIKTLGEHICFELSMIEGPELIPVEGSVLRLRDGVMRPCSEDEVEAMIFLLSRCIIAPPRHKELYDRGIGI